MLGPALQQPRCDWAGLNHRVLRTPPSSGTRPAPDFSSHTITRPSPTPPTPPTPSPLSPLHPLSPSPRVRVRAV